MNIKTGILPLLLGIFFMPFSGIRAEFPEDSLFVETEEMTLRGDGWKKTDGEESQKLYFSGNAFLKGNPRSDGEAAVRLECPEAGVWNIWLRYLYQARQKSEAPLELRIVQGGFVQSMEFDRSQPSGREETKANTSEMRWSRIKAELKQGPFELILKKSKGNARQQNPDCLLITKSGNHIPDDHSFFSLYMQIENHSDMKESLSFAFNTRRSDGKYFHEHASMKYPTAVPIKPGGRSKWVNISEALSISNREAWNKLVVRAFRDNRKEDLPAASFTVRFSTTGSMKGLVREFERKGSGNAAAFLIMPGKECRISTEIEESAKNLQRSKELKTPGKKPVRFPFMTSAAIGPLCDETLTAELEALSGIGINIIRIEPEYAERLSARGWTNVNVSFYAWSFQKKTSAGYCPEQADWTRLRENIAESEKKAKTYPAKIRVSRYASLADEPVHSYRKHLLLCEVCRKAFPAYLKEMNVPWEELRKEVPSLSSMEDARPLFDPEKPVIFYWSSRYGTRTVRDFLLKITETARELSPDWKSLVNFGGGVRSNLVADGLDWFELFNSGALTCGMQEDYGAWMKTLQLRGYYMGVMRAACRKNKVVFGPLSCYPGNTPWEFVSGSFSQLGQGARRFCFFNYGPHYVPTSSPCSAIQWVHDETKFVTYSAGAVEDDLLDAEVEPGDAALLYSTTSDLWNTSEKENGSFSNLYGMERTFLYLLLRHLQIRPDILSEEDLPERLSRYRILFATDSHIRKEYIPILRDWVKNGGILYAGANALAFDEYNRPSGLLETAGINRTLLKADKDMIPGRPPFELRNRKPLDTVEAGKPFDALFGVWKLSGGETLFRLRSGIPALVQGKFGKGKVFASAVFPSMSYIRQAETDPEIKMISAVKYPASGAREFLGRVLREAGIVPAVRCSEPLLEANLLRKGNRLLLFVSNWSGKPRQGEVTLSGFGKPASKIESLHGQMKTEENTTEKLRLSGTFGNGELILINLN